MKMSLRAVRRDEDTSSVEEAHSESPTSDLRPQLAYLT